MEAEDAEAAGHTPTTVGDRLRLAREAAGMSREDVASHTRIAERHLVAIEENRLSDLTGRTYAIGFSRAYARAVGLDEAEIANAVRDQLDLDEQSRPRVQIETFEPGDPARVPSARLAWSAALLGVLTVGVLLYLFWPSFLSPQGSLPDLLKDETEKPVAVSTPDTVKPSSGAVVFTATEPRVWIKIYDGAGNQLFQNELAEGESYTLPSDAVDPMLWTARPDALAITVGGKSVPKISETLETVKDVPVSAAALLARTASPAPAPSVDASPPVREAAQVAPAPRATATPAATSRPQSSARAESGRSREAAPQMAEPRPAVARPAARPAPATAPTQSRVPAGGDATIRLPDAVSPASTPDSTVSE